MKRRKILFIVLATVAGVVVIAANVICLFMSEMLNKYTVGVPTNISAVRQAEILNDGKKLAIQIEAEGIVMVENNGTLPLENFTNVNVFGWSSVDWVTNGSGSGGVAGACEDFYTALDNNGIKYNFDLKNMYSKYMKKREYFDKGALYTYAKDFCKLYEPEIGSKNHYTDKLLSDALAYSDTALVVIGRVGGESSDAPKSQYKYYPGSKEVTTDDTRGYLDISVEEERLLEYVGANYDNVIVIINSTNAMTLGAVESIPGIDAALVVGCTGMYGTQGIIDVIKGDISPSGKLSDTYVYDFATNASYANAGYESLGIYANGYGFYPYDGKTINGNVGDGSLYESLAFVDYSEGIYLGYKWYETADAEEYWDALGGYDKIVQYPFGYGLSYAEFDWDITAPVLTELDELSEVKITVTVTNTSDMPAKEVVQLYYTAPYEKGGIEKSAAELGDFAKTKLLAKDEADTLTLKIKKEDMASYDAYDDNGNGHIGYELDAGEYIISLRTDSHTVVDEFTFNLENDINYDKATNLFTGDDAVDGYGIDDKNSVSYMTRADFENTFPETAADRAISEEIADLNLYKAEDADAFINENDEPIIFNYHGITVFENGTVNKMGLELGRDFNHEKWNDLLEQLSIKEMSNLVLHNGYGASLALPSIGKPTNYEADGPNQIGSFNLPKYGTGFPNATMLAQTFSKDLSYKFGNQVGREADMLGYRGWYGPGCNLHRSPLGGRNYEYYSEDSVLSGIFATHTARGALDTGTYMYLKHFVAYDQESYRDGVYVWMTEQTLRQTYALPFEMAIKNGGCTGLMTAYNRIGAVWTGGSYALLTSLIRDEWGFNGAVLTDYSDHHDYMCFDQALRAGGDIWMDGVMTNGKFACETESNTFKHELRRASKNLIYIWLNAYAEADAASFIKSISVWFMPWWGWLLIGLDAIYVIGFGVWGLLVFKKHKCVN